MFASLRHRFSNRLSATSMLLVLAILWHSASLADVTTIGPCEAKYAECLQEWKQRRVEFLKSETGYLNLSGLFWLKNGANSFGSAASNSLIFPDSAAAQVGVFELQDDGIIMRVNKNADVRMEGRRVASMSLPDDSQRPTVVITHGSLAWSVIKRDSQYAVRLRDFESPLLTSFGPIIYYPVDPDLRVAGRLELYDEPRVINVGTVIEGLSYNPRSPGVVKFDIGGEQFELEAYDAGGELFFVFGDQTSGRGTYPAGRFLYADAPGPDGEVLLDFNTAHNPPCAFNEFATCPVASPRNRMVTRVEAGERYDSKTH
jgi:uncharacterized protein (DUF1684 family)